MRREVGLEKTKAILKPIGFVMSKSKSKRGRLLHYSMEKSMGYLYTKKREYKNYIKKLQNLCVAPCHSTGSWQKEKKLTNHHFAHCVSRAFS